MAFKNYTDVKAAVDMKADKNEWQWFVHAGTKGLVKSTTKDGVEVHFDCGVVRICKESELQLWSK